MPPHFNRQGRAAYCCGGKPFFRYRLPYHPHRKLTVFCWCTVQNTGSVVKTQADIALEINTGNGYCPAIVQRCVYR